MRRRYRAADNRITGRLPPDQNNLLERDEFRSACDDLLCHRVSAPGEVRCHDASIDGRHPGQQLRTEIRVRRIQRRDRTEIRADVMFTVATSMSRLPPTSCPRDHPRLIEPQRIATTAIPTVRMRIREPIVVECGLTIYRYLPY